MKATAIVTGAIAIAIAQCLVGSARAEDSASSSDSAQDRTELPKVEVHERRPNDDSRPKLQHIMKEVDGPLITVTKKTSITKLDSIPTIVDNNLRALFAQTPGLFVSEQQSPGQANLSYRGIGNPQESEFVAVMLDGIPLMSDWIGYPTIYLLPLPQQISEVQLIRGGSSLLYGPEPPPVVNMISRKPIADRPLGGYAEAVVGGNGLLGTFGSVSGTSGNWDYLANAQFRRSDGERDNGDSTLGGVDLHIGYNSDMARTALDLHANQLETGDPGKLSYPQFIADPDQTTTPYNKLWTDRYVLALTDDRFFSEDTELVTKLWGGYQDNASRSQDRGPAPTTATVQDDQFRFYGLDARALHRWGRGNALTVGTTMYHSDAPFRQFIADNLSPGRYDRFGVPCANPSASNCARLRQSRSTDYAAVYAENVFRFPGRWHFVPSVRLERERLKIDETIRPSNLTRGLVDREVTHNVPLFGLGFGNDFGHANETYFNVSQGWRPVRYFDIGSPFGNTSPDPINDPDPTHVLSWEAGVHGTPANGLFYDVSLFRVDVKDRIESQQIPGAPPGNTINANTGDTRHRGFEGQIDYDFLAAVDPKTSRHLSVFANLSLLDAEFTASAKGYKGNTPAFSPDYLARFGLAYREDKHFKFALSVVSVASQYWQDSNLDNGTPAQSNYIPAKVPSYTVADVSADWWVTPDIRLLGGIYNIADKTYYARVFGGGLEPAVGRTIYGGASWEF
ncbi:MAG TPA: TonB-dependent receptor [Dokdonella sp.]|uniref:TonB-dependent receptor family protein n=1 Tax=Dokdonella sp. TaxID=2291710 RepID=UPI002D7E2C95|nr:TonB-dependent receptor [Dokdonella sp.]HET9032162.1 TonB-dependent receptor [Dokdonella sp.]